MKKVIGAINAMVVCVFAAVAVYDVELSYNDNFMDQYAIQTFIATADSISEAAFFCGGKIIPGTYQFQLEDANENPISIWINSDSAGLHEYELVSATFNPKVYVKKGFTYRLRIRHSQYDDYSTNFYYNRDNPYDDGELIGHSDWDLAARIKGFNDFPKDLFGMNSHLLNTRRDNGEFYARDKWEACIDSMKAMGITWDRVGMCAWQHFQQDIADVDSFHYDWCDSLMKLFALDSINVLWYFTMSTKWAGSDSVYNNWDVYYSFPAKLFEPVLINDTINLNNYFGQYVYKFVKRYGPNGDFWQENPGLPYYPIKYYEMWNEPEWGIKDGHYNDLPSFWGDTVTIIDPYYDSLITADGDRTSLMDVYARLCIDIFKKHLIII